MISRRLSLITAVVAAMAVGGCGVATDLGDDDSTQRGVVTFPSTSLVLRPMPTTSLSTVDIAAEDSGNAPPPSDAPISSIAAESSVEELAPMATTTTRPTTSASATTSVTPTSTTTTTTASTTTTTLLPLAGVSTRCSSVALVGDSTAVGLDGSNGVLSSADTVTARLIEIGVADVRFEVSGGRSIVETLPGQINGVDAIRNLQGAGFNGCWVIVLGTNDAANISAGSNATAQNRVNSIVDALAGESALWINASTTTTSGHWARANILAWNADLLALLSGQSSVALADWDRVNSSNAWIGSDGIHPNATGLAARAQFIADNLRVFYPA